MTRYRVTWSDVASSQLRKIDHSVRRRIVAKVDEAAEDPFRVATRLVGSPYCRLRVGDWRIILEIDRGAIRIIVIEVKHRRNVYQ